MTVQAKDCKKEIEARFSCVCPVYDHEFRHNIIKIAVDPRGRSRVDPQFVVNDRTDV